MIYVTLVDGTTIKVTAVSFTSGGSTIFLHNDEGVFKTLRSTDVKLIYAENRVTNLSKTITK